MRKMFLTAAITLIVFAVKAQTISQQTLEGHWNVVYMETNGMIIDFAKKTIDVTKEVKDMYGDEAVEMLKGQVEEILESNGGMSMDFKGATVTVTENMGGETFTEDSTYQISATTPVIITFTMPNGEKRVDEAVFKDGNLEIVGKENHEKLILKKA
jgi:hypothetical protein